MSNEYFDGLSQLSKEDHQSLIWKCCDMNRFEFLSLIVKYSSKNEKIIINGLNWDENDDKNSDKNSTPLLTLLRKDHCSDEWLDLLLFKIANVISTTKVKIIRSTLQKAYEYSIKDKRNENWANLILTYAKKVSVQLHINNK